MRTERLAVPLTTTAAEGLPRRYFTFAELEEMTAAGILGEDERIELIGGEIVPMSPRDEQHEMLRTALNIYWVRQLPDILLIITPTTFRMSEDTYFEPDFVSIRSRAAGRGLAPPPPNSWSKLPTRALLTILDARPDSTPRSGSPIFG